MVRGFGRPRGCPRRERVEGAETRVPADAPAAADRGPPRRSLAAVMWGSGGGCDGERDLKLRVGVRGRGREEYLETAVAAVVTKAPGDDDVGEAILPRPGVLRKPSLLPPFSSSLSEELLLEAIRRLVLFFFGAVTHGSSVLEGVMVEFGGGLQAPLLLDGNQRPEDDERLLRDNPDRVAGVNARTS